MREVRSGDDSAAVAPDTETVTLCGSTEKHCVPWVHTGLDQLEAYLADAVEPRCASLSPAQGSPHVYAKPRSIN
jgi:hypothetical protein